MLMCTEYLFRNRLNHPSPVLAKQNLYIKYAHIIVEPSSFFLTFQTIQRICKNLFKLDMPIINSVLIVRQEQTSSTLYNSILSLERLIGDFFVSFPR